MKKPFALLITDTHLHDGNIDLVKDIFKQAKEYCIKNNIKYIFHLGDWFTSRKSQSQAVLLATKDIIYSFYNIAKMNIIKGNHDAVEADSEDSFLDVFDDFNNFSVSKKETQINFGDLCINMIPYFKESGSYLSRLENITNFPVCIKHKILLTHVAVNGVRNNDGSVIENTLPGDIFKQYDYVYVGHYHNQSKIGNNIYYIGSAYASNFGENNEKGFTLLYNDGSHEFIKSKFKEYIKVSLDITDEESIKKAKKQYANSPDNVRFVFQGDQAELKHVNKEKYAELGIDVDFNKNSAIPMNNDDLIEKAGSLSFDRENIFKAFDTFCEIKHIEDNSIGKTYLEKI